jgi:ABC-2 type transport system ATP-binding protein
MKECIEARNLRKSFGSTEAVRGVSFSIARGEVFGLVGPDGAGKTTVMRILAAILAPDSGRASILGLDSVKDRSGVHERIAYMSQRFGLYQDLTVEENMRFYAELYGVKRDELTGSLHRLLNWSSLSPFRDRPAGKLSGGMKQKLGLACALVHTPEILLLDEPTNGVDPVSRREFWELLYRLVAEGLTILTTTAYLDEAERCSRLAFMERGSITATGSPGEIVSLIQGGVRCIRSSRPFRDASLLNRRTDSVSTVFGSEVHIMGRVTSEEIQELTGCTPETVQGSVEDAFVFLSADNDG